MIYTVIDCMGAVQHMTPDYNEAVTHARYILAAVIRDEDGRCVESGSRPGCVDFPDEWPFKFPVATVNAAIAGFFG